MQRIIEALNASIDPSLLMQRVAEQTCLFSPKADGAAVSIYVPGDGLAIVSTYGAVASQLGRVLPLEETFQVHALRSGKPEVVDDIGTDTRICPQTRDVAHELGIRSWVAIPLHHNGNPIGALSVVSGQTHAFSDDRDTAAIVSMSSFIAALIGSHAEMSRLLHELFSVDSSGAGTHSTARFLAELLIPGRTDGDRDHDFLDQLLIPGSIDAVFQPIVDLQSSEIVAVEGLSRFPSAPEPNVKLWFQRARELGRGIALETQALNAVLHAGRGVPRDLPIAVNLSPAAVVEPAVHQILFTAERDLIVEITEHEPFPRDLSDGIASLRSRGIQIAVDDAGAGYSNLTEILRLRPDIVKIDGELTIGLEDDPVRRALTLAIVELAKELDAVTVAESVENRDQQAALRLMNIDWGQGFLLGRPARVADLQEALVRRDSRRYDDC